MEDYRVSPAGLQLTPMVGGQKGDVIPPHAMTDIELGEASLGQLKKFDQVFLHMVDQ